MKLIRKYLDLVRFSHTIFALPFALGTLFLASSGIPDLKVLVKVLLCMVTARNAAMAFNRIVDIDIDAKNKRTEGRHLVTGSLKLGGVVLFTLANSALFVFGAYLLNSLAFWLSIPTLIVLMSYSLWKRFSWACHLFLGLSIGISPVGAWVAARGELDIVPVGIGLFLMLWIAGFDVIYSLQDREIDVKLGLKSIPARFGEKGALLLAKVFHVLMVFVLVTLPVLPVEYFGTALIELNKSPWWIFTALTTMVLAYIHFGRNSNSLDEIGSGFFWANGVISGLAMITLIFLGFLI
jgi:4-hydroxybenzoate polyprenyltransferase